MNNLGFTPTDLVSVSDLQRNYAHLLARLNLSQKPLLVLKKNKPEAVIVLPEIFSLLVEKLRQYEEEKALEAIGIYEKEKKEKKLRKLKTIRELFK